MLVSANRSAHAKPIFKLLNILTFRQLYVYSIQMFMYKYNNGLLQFFLIIMLKLNHDVHSYNTGQSTQIHISIATLEIRLRSVIIKGAIISNYFNTRLKFTSYSIMNYKCILKQFILNNDVNIQHVSQSRLVFLHLHAVFVFNTMTRIEIYTREYNIV